MMSNMAVAMRDVMQMCFVGFSIPLELSTNGRICTHCQAVQVTVMTSRTLNCGVFFSPKRGKITFTHACMCVYLHVGWMLTVLLVVQAYFKRISLLYVQTLEKSTQNEITFK